MAKEEVKKNTKKKPSNFENKKNQPLKETFQNNLPFEIANIVIICFGILLVISVYFGGGGFLGLALSSFFKGLFGIGAYLLPIIMISFCSYLFFYNKTQINIFKVIVSTIAFCLFVALFHLISKEKYNSFSNYGSYLLNEYKTGHFLDGGLVGALLGDGFSKILGTVTSYIVIIVLLIASVFLLTGKSFLMTIKNGFKDLSNYFYYEYDVEQGEDEDIEDDEDSEGFNLFYAIRQKIQQKKKKPRPKPQKQYAQNIRQRQYEDRQEYEQPQKTLKKYNNYIYDGTNKYKKVQPAVFFDMSSKPKNDKDRKINFAMDEINNPKKYDEYQKETYVPEFLKNDKNMGFNIYQKEDINLGERFEQDVLKTEKINDKPYENNFFEQNVQPTNTLNKEDIHIKNSTANIVSDMVYEYEKNIKNADIFKVQSKEEYLNEVYKKKKVDPTPSGNFDIDLKFAKNSNIDDVFKDMDLAKYVDEHREQELYKIDKDLEEDKQEDFSISNEEDDKESFDKEEQKVFEEFDKQEDVEINDKELDDDIAYEDIDILEDVKEDVEENNEQFVNNSDTYKENLPIDDKEYKSYPKYDDLSQNSQNNAYQEDEPKKTYLHKQEDVFPKEDKAYIKKDKDGFTMMQKSDTTYKPPLQNNLPKNEEEQELQNQNEPLIIRPDVEKMVTKLEVEEDIKKEYVFPKLEFLDKNPSEPTEHNDMELRENSYTLIKTLKSFNVNAQVINISKGPSVTRYEISIEDGIKVSKILGLSDNLALSLAATSIRIEAPIPGKSAVGIEVPNKNVTSVYLSEVICSEKFQKFKSKASFGLGKDITGNVIVTDIADMPHMLIAGATGSGKSVCINTLITSILYKASPEEVRLMMIDPKVVELSVYNGIPHLLTPVVTEPEKAASVLNWAVSEMSERYNLFSKTGTRNLDGYNRIQEENNMPKLPKIVIIIDELADLMMVAAKEVESSICRLAQLARAAGIHLIIATQRPSVDVITGLIKSNIPSRIAFAVSSGTDSRTILDTVGAEKLLGKGDMLFKARDMNKPLRIQGAFISDKEVETIISFIKENSTPNYDEHIINKIDSGSKSKEDAFNESSDELTEDVIAFLVRKGKASTSMIQRQFRIGYNRAARIIEELEDRGIVSSENGSKQRDVLMDKYQYEEYQNRYDNY